MCTTYSLLCVRHTNNKYLLRLNMTFTTIGPARQRTYCMGSITPPKYFGIWTQTTFYESVLTIRQNILHSHRGWPFLPSSLRSYGYGQNVRERWGPSWTSPPSLSLGNARVTFPFQGKVYTRSHGRWLRHIEFNGSFACAPIVWFFPFRAKPTLGYTTT